MKFLTNAIHRYNAKKELKVFSEKLKREIKDLCLEDIVDLVFNKYNRFFWIKQVQTEILKLCKIIERGKPTNILEIGTAQGGSLFLFSRITNPKAKIISVDLPSGDFGGGYPKYRRDFYQSFVQNDQQLNLLRDNSHSINTFRKVQELLGESKLDFLFIDGDHTYNGVKKDLEMYKKLVAHDGIIAMHDIAVHKVSSDCKVHIYWDEIKTKFFKNHEIISSKSQLWAGIGLLYMSQDSMRRYGKNY